MYAKNTSFRERRLGAAGSGWLLFGSAAVLALGLASGCQERSSSGSAAEPPPASSDLVATKAPGQSAGPHQVDITFCEP